MSDEHHEWAPDRGVRVVHGCGFDSIPRDVGTLVLRNAARSAAARRARESGAT